MDAIGPLQIQVMNIIWASGQDHTVSSIVATINERREKEGAKPLAYTTILTVMRNLAKRSVLRQNKTGHRADTYTAIITRDHYRCHMLGQVCSDLFGGNMGEMIDFLQKGGITEQPDPATLQEAGYRS